MAYQWNRRFRAWNTLILLGIAVVMTSSQFFFTLFLLMRVEHFDPKIFTVLGGGIFILATFLCEDEKVEPWECDPKPKD